MNSTMLSFWLPWVAMQRPSAIARVSPQRASATPTPPTIPEGGGTDIEEEFARTVGSGPVKKQTGEGL